MEKRKALALKTIEIAEKRALLLIRAHHTNLKKGCEKPSLTGQLDCSTKTRKKKGVRELVLGSLSGSVVLLPQDEDNACEK